MSIKWLFLFFPLSLAWAQRPGPPPDFFAVGVFTYVRSEDYAEEGVVARAFPLISFKYQNLSLLGPGLNYRATALGPLQLSLLLNFDGSGYEGEDSPRLQGMERNSSLNGGFNLSTPIFSPWQVQLQVEQDLLGRSGGLQSWFQLAYQLRVGQRWQVAPNLRGNLWSERYLDYYYGVTPGEALGNRPSYRVASWAMFPQLGFLSRYFFQERWMLLSFASWSFFPSQVRRSPLVDRATNLRFSLGLSYRF